MREALQVEHDSLRTEPAYVDWVLLFLYKPVLGVAHVLDRGGRARSGGRRIGGGAMKHETVLPKGDWPLSFDAVRLEQHLRFRALPAREKIQALEDLAELVERVQRSRRAAGLPVIDPRTGKVVG